MNSWWPSGFFVMAKKITQTERKYTGERRGRRGQRRLKDVHVDEISLVDNPAVPDATFVIAKRDENQPEECNAVKTEVPDIPEGNGEVEAGAEAEKGDQVAVGKDSRSKVAAAFVKSIRVLRAVAGDMEPQELGMLAQMLDYTKFGFRDASGSPLPEVSDVAKILEELKAEHEGVFVTDDKVDLSKASFVLGPTGFEQIAQARELLSTAVGSFKKISKQADTKGDDAAGGAKTDTATAQAPASAQAPAPAPAPAEVVIEKKELSVWDQAGEILAKQRQAEAERAAEARVQKQREAEAQALNAITALGAKLDATLGKYDEFAGRLERATGKVSAAD